MSDDEGDPSVVMDREEAENLPRDSTAVVLAVLGQVRAALDAAQTSSHKMDRLGHLCARLEPELRLLGEDGADLDPVEIALRAILECVERLAYPNGVLGRLLSYIMSRKWRSALEKAELRLRAAMQQLGIPNTLSLDELEEEHFRENDDDASKDFATFREGFDDAAARYRFPTDVVDRMGELRAEVGPAGDTGSVRHMEMFMDAEAAGNNPFFAAMHSLTEELVRQMQRELVATDTQIHGSALDIHLDDFLGGGTFGLVYGATLRDPETGEERAVAVKRGKPVDADDEAQLRNEDTAALRLEASNWQKLMPHDNIVAVLGLALKERHLWLVMERCHMSLHHLLHNYRDAIELSFEDKTTILRGIARGMAHIHSMGLVHRDLKPGNIVLSADLGCAKICDFGYATANVLNSQNALTTTRCGTQVYMAPEVFEFPAEWSSRADVYSFGILAWEVLHRHKPYPNLRQGTGGRLSGVKHYVANGGRPEFDPNLMLQLWLPLLITRCWESDRSRRPYAARVLSYFEARVPVDAEGNRRPSAPLLQRILRPFRREQG